MTDSIPDREHEYYDRCEEYKKRILELEDRICKQRLELRRLNYRHRVMIDRWLDRLHYSHELENTIRGPEAK